MGTILLYVALTLVLVWTVRIARSKGRNPWLWGGLAFILMLIPDLKLLAVIPMIVLMFMKGAQQPNKTPSESSSCPRCRGTFIRNARFCTSCGWDLAERYYPETVLEDEKSVATQAVEDLEPVGVSDPVRQGPVHEAPPAPAPESPAEASIEAESPEASPDTSPETSPDPAPDTSMDVTLPPPFTPRKKPESVVLPTPAVMTERGVGLFNQGRIQESIDQFTKAIALDPNYVDAWARRAEAYAQLGRGNEAAEDRRRLEALNAGSPGG